MFDIFLEEKLGMCSNDSVADRHDSRESDTWFAATRSALRSRRAV
jgi:hypothetical protein